MAQTVKNLPAMQETQVQSLGPKDPLEKEMATYSSILAWGIAWTEEPDRLQFIGLQRVGHDRATVETVSDFIFRGSKITADGDCNHEIKRRLLLGRKVMTNLHSILKSRDITLSTKVHLVKAMVFPVVMYGCESWTVKKAERGSIDAFELWYWRRLLRVPWTARTSNQSIQKRSVLGVHWKD